jgi:hypothetical protein
MRFTFVVLFVTIQSTFGFVPARVMKSIIETIDKGLDLSVVSESLTHDEILKRGLIQSVAQYLYEKPNGTLKINLTKIETGEYYYTPNLFSDYYELRVCNIPLDDKIGDLQLNVASVDFDSSTKDMPYAHFDAEKFIESNERIIQFISLVNYSLSIGDFKSALKRSGEL